MFESVKSFLGDTSKKVTEVFSGNLDPSNLRRTVAGLFPGAATSLPGPLQPTYTDDQFDSVDSVAGRGSFSDWRVKVGLPPQAQILYKVDSQFLAPLANTDGVIFPYTPTIQVSHKANYQPQRLTHSNYAAYFYEGSEVNAIQITGDFTVQNQEEGRYLFAAIHFFRSASKMFFGSNNGDNQGNPPPILQLAGYGSPYFPNVKCVLTDFSHTMPGDVDYIEVVVGNNKVHLPTTSQISVTLQPVYSRSTVRSFSLEGFAKGDLVNKGFI